MTNSPDYPVLLMPVKIETRFVQVTGASGNSDQLWVRIFPDQLFVRSFDPVLTAEERADRRAFINERRSLEKWSALVQKYGAPRASWIVNIDDNTLRSQRPEDVKKEIDFSVEWLPDFFKAYLYRAGNHTPVQTEQFAPIDKRQSLRLLDPEDDWVSDFELAIKKGLGKKFELNFKNIERILVVGMWAKNAQPSAAYISDLFRNHQYTEGFSFIDYGTPTNNIGWGQEWFLP